MGKVVSRSRMENRFPGSWGASEYGCFDMRILQGEGQRLTMGTGKRCIRSIPEEEPPDVVVHAEPGVHEVVAHVRVEGAVGRRGVRVVACFPPLGARRARGRGAEEERGDDLAEVGGVELGVLGIAGAGERGG